MTTTLKPAQPGVYTNVPFAEYRAIDAWGSSALKAMRRGPPARVQWERDNPSADTEATRIGTAAHCLFLTPELFDREYVTKPDGMSFSTKEGKAWRDERAGKKILTYDEGQLVLGVVKALLQKLVVEESIGNALHKELTLVWKAQGSGGLCKTRPDWVEGHHTYDLKVSRHAEGRAVAYRAFVEGWMHQLAHHTAGAIENGLDVRGGRLVVVAPKPPHFVYTLEVKPDALALLDLENLSTVRDMVECEKRGEWDDTPETWQKVEPPAAALVEFSNLTLSNIVEED